MAEIICMHNVTLANLWTCGLQYEREGNCESLSIDSTFELQRATVRTSLVGLIQQRMQNRQPKRGSTRVK